MKISFKIITLLLLFLVSLRASEFPPSYYKLPLNEKKKFFFEFFVGEIELENRKILKEREFVESLKNNKNLQEDSYEYRILEELQVKYKVNNIYDYDKFLRRIDIIPPSMALAQAAIESGWGTSRFFKEANNIFGEWTYNPNMGIIPLRRKTGKKHFIRVFTNLQESIAAYMLNLNRTGAYYQFRAKRREMRLKDVFIDGVKLSETMSKYSGIGHNYIKMLKNMIKRNNLAHYDNEFYLFIRSEKILNLQ